MIRVGTVASTSAAAHTARVEFSDSSEDLESWDLPVLITRPGDYSLPAVGTLVACAMEEGPEGLGYVLGALYNEEDKPPTDQAGRRVVAGDDVRLGSADATEQALLGNKTVAWLRNLVESLIPLHTHGTALGPSGPPVQAAQFVAEGPKLEAGGGKVLSEAVKVGA